MILSNHLWTSPQYEGNVLTVSNRRLMTRPARGCSLSWALPRPTRRLCSCSTRIWRPKRCAGVSRRAMNKFEALWMVEFSAAHQSGKDGGLYEDWSSSLLLRFLMFLYIKPSTGAGLGLLAGALHACFYQGHGLIYFVWSISNVGWIWRKEPWL